MADNTFAITHLVGTSSEGVDAAIRNGIKRAGESLRNLDWFEVTEIRGRLDHSSDVLWNLVGPRWVDTPAYYGPGWTSLSESLLNTATLRLRSHGRHDACRPEACR